MARKVLVGLQVILHLGAHRTGTTSLQRALQKNAYNLRQIGLTYWGPNTTRGGMFSGLLRPPALQTRADTKALVARNIGGMALRLADLKRQGQDRLLISEENIIGAMRNNLRAVALYPDIGARLTPFNRLFWGHDLRLGLCLRSYEAYWTSAIAYAIMAGHRAPTPQMLSRLTEQKSYWRQVIGAISRGFPRAQLVVWEFEAFIGQTRAQFSHLLGLQDIPFMDEAAQHNQSASLDRLRAVLQARGDHCAARRLCSGAVFAPFSVAQCAHLQGQFQQDLAWLKNQQNPRLAFIENPTGHWQKISG